jgi:DUF4097 and DUF4098 domain-containing protein YvlB
MPEQPQQVAYVRRRSLAGPITLILIGVIFLLGNMHVLSWPLLFHYWARYWPVLIILWGVIKLLEHWQDTSRGLPSRGIGFGGYCLLIFLILIGLSLSTADRVNWNALQDEMDWNGDFLGFFGNTYAYSHTQEQPFPAGGSLRVINDRGEVTINPWDEAKIKVVVSKKLMASNEQEGQKVDEATQPTITVAGSLVTLNANTSGGGNHPVQSNLEIYVPRQAAVDVATRRGDVTVGDRQGEVKIDDSRGDVTASNIVGSVSVQLRRGSVRASNIKGDVSVEGRVDDTAISEVSGAVRLSGDFFGEMDLSKIAKTVTFKSSRTDMELARLDGDLAMQSGDLRAKSVTGPVRIATRSKDIHLEDVAGEVRIEDSNGMIEVHAGRLPLESMEISNRRGEIQITLPAKAAFELQATARRGDIDSEFDGIKVESEHNESRASGTVGAGGPRLHLSNDGGGIQIRKSTMAMPAPPAPPATPTPSAPPARPRAD